MPLGGNLRLTIRSTRYLGNVPLPQGRGWRLHGQDGGQSIDLGEESLFVFSDTLLSAARGGDPRFSSVIPNQTGLRGYFLPNCAGLAPNPGPRAVDLRRSLGQLRFFTDAAGWPREILTATDDERRDGLRFWPQHGILLGGAVYLYYLGILCTDPTDTWGFRCLGTGLARLDPASGRCERLRRQGEWCFWPVIGDDFHLGVQVLARDGWLYVFASLRHGLDGTLRLARVRPEAITDPESYEYLAATSPRWTRRLDDALDLGPCASELSVSYNAFLDRYLMTYIHPHDKVLTLRTAEEPWGPYGPPQTVARVPHLSTSEMVFLTFEHPQFATDGGRRLVVSYSQPRFVANSLVSVSLG